MNDWLFNNKADDCLISLLRHIVNLHKYSQFTFHLKSTTNSKFSFSKFKILLHFLRTSRSENRFRNDIKEQSSSPFYMILLLTKRRNASSFSFLSPSTSSSSFVFVRSALDARASSTRTRAFEGKPRESERKIEKYEIYESRSSACRKRAKNVDD
jgi:hypothetical protein